MYVVIVSFSFLSNEYFLVNCSMKPNKTYTCTTNRLCKQHFGVSYWLQFRERNRKPIVNLIDINAKYWNVGMAHALCTSH